MPITDYRPGLAVRIVGRLPAPLVVRLLRPPNGETVPVLERPDEYTGYVVRSGAGGNLVASTTFVYTRDALDVDGRYAFRADAQVFSVSLNLLRTTVRPVDRDDGNASVD